MLIRVEVAEEGQRGQLCHPPPWTPTKEKPQRPCSTTPCLSQQAGLLGCPQSICSEAKRIPFDVLTRECRGISSSAGDAANHVQEWMALPEPAAKLTCPNPASGTVSELTEERDCWTLLAAAA